MSYGDNEERSAAEKQEAGAAAEEPRAPQTLGATEDDEQDPEVAEIEQDPSRNPPNELLRDIKGG